tara:strand:- start:797 stop:1654 length:858 start_codon:yes stop_codon:yes gene_type:complete
MHSIFSEDDVLGVNLTLDLNYASYDETNLLMHLLLPQNELTDKPIPIIIYVPGSAWFKQNLGGSIPQIMKFVEQSGYAAAIVGYRPSTVAKSPAQLMDIKSSIRYLRANADAYNIDPNRVAIWGTSSGGHIASLVGLTEGIERFETKDNREESSSVKAVINFFGPTDFLRMDDFPSAIAHNEASSPESSVIGGPIQDPKNKSKVDEYNPLSYILEDKEYPPFLIMHGDSDHLVPFNQSLILYEALRDANHSAEFYKLLGAGHGNRFFTQQTMQIVLDFLNLHFKQ